MKAAVSYIRVSSTMQLDGDGPERQRLAIQRFADANGYLITREFVEDISGTKDTKSRAVFSELLDYCAEHGIHTIIIEKADRISRDMFVGLSIVGDCAARKLSLLDADTGRDLAHPNGPYETFVIHILMAAAQLNRDIFVHQSGVARKRIRSSGRKCEGAKGYRELNPAAFQRIHELHRQGLTERDIAATLNSEGVPTLKGGAWNPSSVHRVAKQST